MRLRGLAKWRDLSQIAAALSFVLVRGLEFTRVTVCRFVPEASAALGAATLSLAHRRSLQAMIGFTVGFNALQLYWLYLLVDYTRKSGLGGERPA